MAVRRVMELRRAGALDDRHGRELVASLGDGGFLTWQSSPHVMWLVNQLRAAGK